MQDSRTINFGVANSVGFSAAVTFGVVVTSGLIESRLGVPQYWPWLLTGLQVLSLWAAGDRRWWGWLLGASVQPPWIAYAILTGQWGFIPGCAISAAIQTYSYVRKPRETVPRRAGIPVRISSSTKGEAPSTFPPTGLSLSVPTK